MKTIIEKIKALFKKYPRIGYELKSFGVTFLGVYIAITGISETTTLRMMLDNSQLFFGAISIAAFRTAVIFAFKLVNVNYRKSTADYK